MLSWTRNAVYSTNAERMSGECEWRHMARAWICADVGTELV